MTLFLIVLAAFTLGWIVRGLMVERLLDDQAKLLDDQAKLLDALDQENTRLTEAVHAQYKLGREHGARESVQ